MKEEGGKGEGKRSWGVKTENRKYNNVYWGQGWGRKGNREMKVLWSSVSLIFLIFIENISNQVIYRKF